MKDFRVSISIKNNLLISEREKLGFTQIEMANFLEVPLIVLRKLENLHTHPDRSVEIMNHVLRIADRLELSVSKLFPKIFNKIKNPRLKGELSYGEILRLSSPQIENMDKVFLENEINKSLKKLPPRLEKVIRRKFGIGEKEMTTVEIADSDRLCAARINSLEAKALRYLRHKTLSDKLKDFNA